ncbi:hypothetical protein GCM10010214_19510 [Streptomyces abikoensis]|nr:hypothetical protein GCM10010214_19510 [Streptomyces abikoensis]
MTMTTTMGLGRRCSDARGDQGEGGQSDPGATLADHGHSFVSCTCAGHGAADGHLATPRAPGSIPFPGPPKAPQALHAA